jgi:hypothetical protein
VENVVRLEINNLSLKMSPQKTDERSGTGLPLA